MLETIVTKRAIQTPTISDDVAIPPLEPGDHLSRAEFHQRYAAHPEIKKAELIQGVVYMPSPVKIRKHGQPHYHLIVWLGMYEAKTPGVFGGDNCTIILSADNEVQPNIFLAREDGPTVINDDDYLEGAPELIIEVAASSASYDLHTKKRLYAQHGVREYIVAQTYEQRLDWFILRQGQYESLKPDEQGILHSETFPGLRLDVAAFWAGDLARLVGEQA